MPRAALPWLLLLPSTAHAFSSGAANGGEGLPEGHPHQACDAISLCAHAWPPYSSSASCPPGMDKVAPPGRSDVFQVSTKGGATGYAPDQLIELDVDVLQRQMLGKGSAGTMTTGTETAKYIGVLLYFVDSLERKVGGWEIPLENPTRFWAPPDSGCDGKALMHAGAEKKNFKERFYFRAPAAQTGSITLRALIKHGDTNQGVHLA